jgi:2-succinyl-5-enolpyruvyl-6-hydroxy-3-cyclohexene-1-carboxylate synthase
MNYSKIPLAQTITELCRAKDIKHIIICPGSRNAPLTIGFTENPYFKVYSIVDERAAAFFALGIAQQTGHPAAVICTSGSAVLNFYPAIAEAFYSDIPIVVISADRPPQFIDIGDGQTIRQENIFEKHIIYSATLKIEEEHQKYNETQINVAINSAIELKGPVHINAPFEEPLYQKTETPTVFPQNVPVNSTSNFLEEDLEDFVSIWNNSNRKLILVGVQQPDAISQNIIDQLAADPSVLVMTETTSNLYHHNFICSIDQLIAPMSANDFKELQPDVLLTFGGMVISKKIKAFLRDFPAKHHWHVDEKKAYDTFFNLSHHFKTSPETFFKAFLPHIHNLNSNYQLYGLSLKNQRALKHKEYMERIPFSDFKAFHHILNFLPKNIILQLGNSAIVRYAQLFSLDKSLKVFCNRGTSGIDGSTSTAIGAAVAANEQVVFLTGDLSFFYDANGLWNNYIPNNFKIILINNSGGGIFRILPGEKDTQNFDVFFETIHSLTAKHLCEMHHINYSSTDDENELQNLLLPEFFSNNEKSALIEIKTPRTINDQVLLDYFKFLI